MTTEQDRTNSTTGKKIVVSIDAMGGDGGLDAIVNGLQLSAEINPDIHFIVHGDSAKLEPLLNKKPGLMARVDMRHTEKVVSMDEKPSKALRSGKDSSMWNALQSVENNEASVAVSCGNTGA